MNGTVLGIKKVNGISIIIPAYKTPKLLEECINSIVTQTYKDYEILIGVDNCEQTFYSALKLSGKYKNIKVYKTIRNVGPYVIKNTLYPLARNKNILFFDSDDVMMPNMLEILSKTKEDIVRFQFLDFTNCISLAIRKYCFFAKGSFFTRKWVLEKAGGFLNWKCAADFEFQSRTKEHFKTKEITTPLFYRRVREESLTKSKETGLKSELRTLLHSKIKPIYTDPYIKPTKTKLKDIEEIMKNKPRIPKIIHQIWIGPKKPPVYMKKWVKLNPDYEYVLWDDVRVANFELENQKIYDDFAKREKECYNGRSDVIRYEILKRYGGIYLDADCDPKRPLDDYLLDNELFTAFLNEQERPGRLASGIIGCVPNHPLMDKCIKNMKGLDVINHPAFKTVGPVYFTEMAIGFNIKVYPSYYFLPQFFYDDVKYDGNFKPYCDHKWGTTKNLYK
jgi:mannosyltransferase OCH1-like enzyme